MTYPIEIKGKTKKQVTKLNLSGCKLTSFPENIFEYTNLTKLVLSNNRIKVIPADILKLKKLKMLDLSNNEIKVLHSAVFKLPKLKILNVYGNQIKKFPKQVFESHLEKIIVGNNPIENDELQTLKEKFEVVGLIRITALNTNNKGTTVNDPVEKSKEIKKIDMKHSIFISYSHKDDNWLSEVKTHLKPLERYYGIDEWDDQKLRTSDKWKDEISKALNNATIAILLFSPYFMASDFIINNELQPLLDNAEKKGTRIMPVMVSPCETLEESGLSDYQAPNGPDKTLVEMNEGEVHRTLSKLVKDIKSIISKDENTTPKIKDALSATSRKPSALHSMLSERENKIYEFIRMKGVASIADVQKEFEIDSVLARRIVAKLKEKNYIVSEGKARNTVYKVNESSQF